MARTIVAFFDDFQAANTAVRDLVDIGFPRENISIVANNRGENASQAAPGAGPAETEVADDTGTGAGVGAGIGAALGGIGGLLVGLGALAIPGIGPVLAAGPLAVALSTLAGAGVGAVAGGVTGGLLGALIGLGIPEEEAGFYAEGVRRGGVLVTVQADNSNADQITDILNRHNPIDIHQRAAQWREQGWQGYDPNAQTVMASQVKSQNGQSYDPNAQTMPVSRQNEFIPATGHTVMEQQGTGENTSFRNPVFNQENPRYSSHYEKVLAGTGYPYDYYVPAYRFGYGLASDPRYQNSTWDVIEPDVYRDWEREHPGTWERFKTAIRYAWEDVNGGPNSL